MKAPPTAILTLPSHERFRYRQVAFGAPTAVWMATRTDELRQCLARTETFQRAGKYVVAVVTYDAARAFDSAHTSHEPGALPLAWFAAFDRPGAYEQDARPFELGAPQVQTSETEYGAAVHRALEHIRAGDVYQVNYTVRARCEFHGSAVGLFDTLVRAVPVPHAAFVDTGAVQIVSLSPELFLQRVGGTLLTRPMKGTASRRPSWDADEAARLALQRSEKDRAENTMIVDLMRNDLGRVCKAGTIRVPELCVVERYPTVHQMISTVTGEQLEDATLFDIFAATFPPGSVTGAPKVRATEIIRNLEHSPRGIYCGTIGLFMPGGDFVCSVAIRTLEIQGNIATLGIGSGIVVDSVAEREWEEVLLKAKFAERRPQEFALYETFRWQPELGFRNLHSHLRRLKRSCDYFARPFPIRRILAVLRELKATLGNEHNRVRLNVDHDQVSFQLMPEELCWPERGVVVMIPEARLDPDDPRLYHKTTLRPEKLAARESAKARGADECLFLNTRDEFTEGTIANVMFKVRGEWLTPSLSCGLLPGVWRDMQIHSGRAREEIVRYDLLDTIEEVRIGNSVRGEGKVIRIILEDGREVYRDKGEAR